MRSSPCLSSRGAAGLWVRLCEETHQKAYITWSESDSRRSVYVEVHESDDNICQRRLGPEQVGMDEGSGQPVMSFGVTVVFNDLSSHQAERLCARPTVCTRKPA